MKHMTDQPPSDRFKADTPQIPGVRISARTTGGNPAVKMIIGLLAVLLIVFVGARWALHPKHAETKATEAQPQIDVPAPAPDPTTLQPHATDEAPGIATTTEMGKPWSSKPFLVRNGLTGENIASILIRLPTGTASQAIGYWAFAIKSPYGNCKLEYITDLDKLKNDYGFAAARHPMVGNPCSHTVFDPLKTANLPGNDVWVRGAIVQGSDLRPPIGVEIQVRGKDILAIRAE